MLYAINYRDMHSAIHGLILFENKNEAEQAIIELKNSKEIEDGEEYNYTITEIFDSSYAVIEEINWRDIEDNMRDIQFSRNDNEYVSSYTDDLEVINSNNAIDIY